MANSSHISHFTFGAYADVGLFKYLIFLLILCVYVLIICANVLLVTVICCSRSLHEPMYLFLCSLLLNELYGSAGLFPFFLLQILRDVHTVPTHACYLQIFCLYMYVNVQFYNLAVMSYDRYLAICRPLQYPALMTPSRVALFIALSWVCPVIAIVIMTTLTATLSLCRGVIDRLYCDNYSVVKLACSGTTVNNVYGLLYTFTVLIGLTLINFYCYARILRVCFSGQKQRQKALNTCVPHLASLLNFFLGCFLEVVQSRFDMSMAPVWLRVVLSLYFITCQPLFNPLLYGLNLSRVRGVCKQLLRVKTGHG